MSSKPFLAMIAHGTDGSDNIEPGVHLRWAFNYKMGFPPRGFGIFRRKSNLKKRVCLNFGRFRIVQLKLPYKYSPKHLSSNLILSTTSKANHFPIEKMDLPDGTHTRVLNIEKKTKLTFSPRTSQIGIECYISEDTKFEAVAKTNKEVVWSKTIIGEKNELKTLSISAHGIDKLFFRGENIKLRKICYWVCEDGDEWELINNKCGFGLPFNQHLDHKTDKYIMQFSGDPCNMDWAIAACRLGPDKICDFKGENFNDLREVISKMQGEGTEIPIGWNLMTLQDDKPPCFEDEEDSPELQISPYDTLLIPSQNPALARILGLYWVDRNVVTGEYYDYKIVAHWPENTLWKLKHEVTFEETEIGWTWFPLFYKKNIVFNGLEPKLISCESRFARVTRGLTFNYPNETTIKLIFEKPVREVQVFITQEGLEAELEAYSIWASTDPVAEARLTKKQGVLSVHADKIKHLRLHGKGIIILRIHYDFEYLPRREHKFLICGVKKEKPAPLKPPTGLKAVCLRGGMTETNEYCEEVELRYRVGLKWELVGDLDNGLLSNAPIGYYIRRKTPRGETLLVNDSNPIHVMPDDPSTKDLNYEGMESCSEVKIKERQYYIDGVEEKGEYRYSISSVDIFGRKSPYSNEVKVELKPPLPPAPASVNAKYLDYYSYNSKNDSFEDLSLTAEEKNLLKTNEKSFIFVRWKWLPNQQKQAPDAIKFKVHFLPGWLNVFRGSVRDVEELTDGFKIFTNISAESDTLVGEWLRQGKLIFKISSNTASSNSIITVDKVPDYLDLPEEESKPKVDKPFVLPVSKPKIEGGAAENYKNPLKWGDPIHEEVIDFPTRTDYEIYIPIDSNINFPGFETDSGNIIEKTKYGQIGVSTVIEEGEGSVSTPSTIIAVSRVKPAEPELPVYPDGETLKATAADFYGKSSFKLRWPKPSDARIKFNVFRAMDQTLFIVDKKNRDEGRNINYDSFIEEFRAKTGIQLNDTPERPEKTIFKEPSPNYSAFTNNMLRVLASLPDNISAFGKLNDAFVRDIDPDDSGMLIYNDKTIDGRGDNKYFYRVRPIDEIGNQGEYGLATMPVECPKVTPVQAPVITKIVGGDRQITLKWSGNPGAGIVGYLLYRTDKEQKAKDIRKMSLIKQNAGDEYSIEVVDSTQLEFEYTDETIKPRKPYFYGLVAVSEGENQKKLYSKISTIKIAQAYDLTPPEAPVLTDAVREIVDEEEQITLTWNSEEPLQYILQREEISSNIFISLTKWLDNGTFNTEENKWIYNIVDDKIQSDKKYIYRLKIRNQSGNTNISDETEAI